MDRIRDVGPKIAEAFKARGMPGAVVAVELVPSSFQPSCPVWRVGVDVGGRSVGRDFTDDVDVAFVLEWAGTVVVPDVVAK